MPLHNLTHFPRFALGLVLAVVGCAERSAPEAILATRQQTLRAVDDHSVLILLPTVVADPADSFQRSLERISAEAEGFTVHEVDAAGWAALSANDFGSYRAIILGDPNCTQDPSPLAAAEAMPQKWGSQINGNVLIAGNAPAYHAISLFRRDDATAFIRQGIAFAAGIPGKTGAYISLSCYYQFGASAQSVPVLAPFNTPSVSFTVSSYCADDVHLVATHPSLSSLFDLQLSTWSCSGDEAFHSFPNPAFAPVVIGLTSPGTVDSLHFADGTSGIPYVLARGVTPAGCGNSTLDPREECDDGNTNACDGCSVQCTLECGNGIQECAEECDDGNHVGGDLCSAICRVERCGNGSTEPPLEECDDGNTNNNDACTNDCHLNNRPPTALCRDVSVPAGAQCKASASINNGSFDPDGDSFTCVQSPPGPYSPATNNVTLTCTDSKNASRSCSGVVTVLDTTPPVFTFVPPAITSSVCVNAAIGQATATDTCGNVTITNNAPAKFPLGKTTVTWQARDSAGNVTTATQVVTAILGDDTSCCPTGSHIILGTSGANNIAGTAGSDCILGRGGDDTIDAGDGNDFVSGGTGRDTINAGNGNDWVYGGDGDDTMDSGAGNDQLFGQAGRDTLMAGNGSDLIDGGSETDSCSLSPDGVDVVLSCEIRF